MTVRIPDHEAQQAGLILSKAESLLLDPIEVRVLRERLVGRKSWARIAKECKLPTRRPKRMWVSLLAEFPDAEPRAGFARLMSHEQKRVFFDTFTYPNYLFERLR